MRRFGRPGWVMLALAGAAVVAGFRTHHGGLPYYADATLTPIWPRVGARIPAHRIAEFSLVDQTGRPFTADSLDGRVHVANFFFATCGDICPLTRRQLMDVARTFADDDRVRIASYSVTPARDSVAALAAYAARTNIDSNRWRLLTGDPATIRRVAASYLVGVGRGSDYGVDSVAHTEMLVLVGSDRRIRGIYNGTLRLDVSQLIADMRTLLAETDSAP